MPRNQQHLIEIPISEVPTILHKETEVVINYESDSEEETDSLGDEVNVNDIERYFKVVVENVVDEEELDTSVKRRHHN